MQSHLLFLVRNSIEICQNNRGCFQHSNKGKKVCFCFFLKKKPLDTTWKNVSNFEHLFHINLHNKSSEGPQRLLNVYLFICLYIISGCVYKLASWMCTDHFIYLASQTKLCLHITLGQISSATHTWHESDLPLAPLLMCWLTPDRRGARHCWRETSVHTSLLFL